jgi:hypothetical protein
MPDVDSQREFGSVAWAGTTTKVKQCLTDTSCFGGGRIS